MPDDLSPAELRRVRKAIRDAHAKGVELGRAEGRREAATLLEYAARLNGSTPHAVAVLKAEDAAGHEHGEHGRFASKGQGGARHADGTSRKENPHPRARAAYRAVKDYLAENGSASGEELAEVVKDAGVPPAKAAAVVDGFYNRGLVTEGEGDSLALHAHAGKAAPALAAVKEYLADYGEADPAELVEHLKDGGLSRGAAARALQDLHHSGELVKEGGKFKLPPAEAKALGLPAGGPGSTNTERAPDPAGDADPLAALADAMLAHAEESLAAGDDPAPGLGRLRELADDPGRLAEVLAAGGADAATVGKCWLSLVRKSWSEEDHPRGKGGVFISKDKLEAAQSDPKVAAELRKEVRPEDAGKLEKVISGEKSPGRTKRGQASHEAAGRRTTREEGRAKTAALLSHLKRVGDLKAKLTADHLHDLADHLRDGPVTVEDVRAMRKALAGAGAGLASFGGARKKDAMVAALVAHAKGKAFDARVREQGFDQEEMRAALAPTPEPAAAKVEPPAVEPTLQELETGVRPGGGRRAQFADPMSRPYRREEDAGGDDARRGSAGVGRPAHGAGVAPGGVPAGGVERLGGGDAGVGGGRGSEADGSKSPLVQDFAHSPPIPANSPPIPANSGADAKRDEGYRKWLQANGYDPKQADGPHPREKDYNASLVEGRDGGWVTPYDKGAYRSKQQAMTAARRALSDYAPRKPAPAKPEPPRAAEVRQEATAAAAEQQASGRIAKQNHERTLAEFTTREGAMWGGPEKAAAVHRRIIEGSLAKGETVPPEVLADYPDLAPQPARPAGADDARPTADESAAASAGAAKVGADSPPIPALSEPAPESPKPPRVLTPAEARAAGDWEGHEVRRGDLAAARGSESHGIGPKNKPGIVYPGDTLNVASRGKKAWVAKLGGKDKKYGRQREFLDGKVSRSGMNKQIVKHTFVLDEQGEYEVGGDEFGDYRHAFTVSDPADRHRAIVEAKLEAGGAVHPDVLADYPDLAKKYGPAAPLAPAGESAAASTPAGRVGAPASPPPAPAKPARAAKKPKAAPARPAWVAADPAASAALDAHAAAPGRAKDVIGNALANAGVLGTDRDGNPTGPAAEPPESDSGRTPAQELAGALAAGHRDQHDLGHSDEEREATASLLRELGAVQVGEVGGSARFDGAVHDGPPGAFTGHALTVTRPGWKIPLGGGRWWVPVKARTGRPGAAKNPPTNVATALDTPTAVGNTTPVPATPAGAPTGGGKMDNRHVVVGDTFKHKGAIREAGGAWDAARKEWTVPAGAELPAGLATRPVAEVRAEDDERAIAADPARGSEAVGREVLRPHPQRAGALTPSVLLRTQTVPVSQKDGTTVPAHVELHSTGSGSHREHEERVYFRHPKSGEINRLSSVGGAVSGGYNPTHERAAELYAAEMEKADAVFAAAVAKLGGGVVA